MYKALGGITIPDELNFGPSNATTYYVDPSLEGALAGVSASMTTARGNIPEKRAREREREKKDWRE
jgi:hypothetical protein